MILHPINGAKGLFLPFETCANASIDCSLYCYQKAQLYPTKKEKIKTLNSLMDKTSEMVANELYKELGGDILHWFVSGDCWRNAETFFWDVIYRLDKMGCKQLGFTRNKKLWEGVPDILILSTDAKDELKQFEDRLCFPDQERIQKHNVRVAIPNNNPLSANVDVGVKIYKISVVMKKITISVEGGCGVGDYQKEAETEFGESKFLSANTKNCFVCFEKNKGCFKRTPHKVDKCYYCDSKITLYNLPKEIQPYIMGADLGLW